MKRRIFFIVASVFATLFIFNNSLQPAEVSGNASGTLVDIMARFFALFGFSPDVDTVTYIVRKTAHFLEFAVQGLFIFGCFGMPPKKRIIYVLFLGLLTACADEYIQLFSPGRSAMIQDVFLDFSGTITATFIFGLSYRFKRK